MLKDECSLKNVKFWLGLEFPAVVKKIEGYFKKQGFSMKGRISSICGGSTDKRGEARNKDFKEPY